MNLAICSAGELYGGVERHIVGMGTWLQRQGEKPPVILFHDRELARQLREIGLEPVILNPRGAWDWSVVGHLGKILKEKKIDVVHAHGYRAVVNCSLARRHHRFAMVRTVHGLLESAGWWTWSGFKGHLYTRSERFFGRRAGSAVVYVTEDLRGRYERFDQGLETKTIHNGIDPLDRAEYPRPEELEPGKFHLAAVGRVTRIKGLDLAVQAMADLDTDLPVVLNIIGTGPMAEELKALAEDAGVSDRVRFLGFKENIYDFLAHCDALVMPSLHEGLPYTVLEAMSLGLPVIASRVGGLAEVLVDGDTGLLVSREGAGEFTAAVDRLCRTPGFAADLGARAKAVQAARFGLNRLGSEYQDLYGKCFGMTGET